MSCAGSAQPTCAECPGKFKRSESQVFSIVIRDGKSTVLEYLTLEHKLLLDLDKGDLFERLAHCRHSPHMTILKTAADFNNSGLFIFMFG